MKGALRFLAASLPFALTLGFWAGPARAQSDTGEIIITVVDAKTGKPVANARTILLGPQTANTLTTAGGKIDYTDVPTGIYRVRVMRSGYQSGVSNEFDVLNGRAVNVRVTLTTSGKLRVIGQVTARTTVSTSTSDINANSPVRRISDSLSDALDQIAGVTVNQDATDPNSAVTVSLGNHDESQTEISLDGIPLAAPGSTVNLGAVGSDLFEGSSVSRSPLAGALGGGVNFRTLQPTQALQVRMTGTTGTFDRSNYSLAATGSIGSLGLALQHTWRGSNSPLTFDEYQDQSGLTYPHEGESTNIGDFLKFRYRLGDERTTLSGTALTNNRDVHAICARDVTVLPCGIGPGNQNFGRFAFGYATLQSLVGTVATNLSVYESTSRQTTDYADRYVLAPPDGLPSFGPPGLATQTCADTGGDTYLECLDPSLATSEHLSRGVAYSASLGQDRHTLTLGGNLSSSSDTSLPTAGSRFEVPYRNAIASTSYTLSDSIKSSDRLTLQPNVSLVNTTTLGTSALLGFGATWRPQPANSFTASLDVGSSQPNVYLNRSYSDPVGAGFNCQAQTATVSGPGDTNGGAQSAVSLSAGWTHNFGSGGSVTANAYSQVQTGQIITALIEEPASYYPSGYLADLLGAYRAPSVCGATAAPPAVYAEENVGQTRRLYRGIDLSGRVPLGRFFILLPSYSLDKAELTAAGGRLGDGPSTTIVGAQLPNRPLHRAGLTLDGYLPRSGIELLANARYTGVNNNQNLGPYVQFSAGISHRFGPGQVTLFENNVFNTYGGKFATDAGALPLPLSNGTSLQTAATPLLPRSVYLSYTMGIGGPHPGPAIASLTNAAQNANAAATQSERAGRGGRFAAVPPPPGTDPLSLATSRPSCDAAAQADAKPLFDGIRAYVAAYQAKTALPAVAGMEVVAHPLDGNASLPYYLELRPAFRRTAPGPAGTPPGPGAPGAGRFGRMTGPPSDAERAALRNDPAFRALRALRSCAYVTALSAADAKTKGIAAPSNGRPALLYVPAVGFVYVMPRELPQGGGSLKPPGT